jgi:hypothetical protein
MKHPIACVLTLLALPMTSLYAGVGTITPSQFGTQSVAGLTLTAGICNVPGVSPDCGGAFTASIGTASGVTLWCVDSQEFDQTNYTANVVSLNTTNYTKFDDGTQVRYGNVGQTPTSTNGTWIDTGISGVTNPNDALTRFQLAAILITMYMPQGTPDNNAANNNVQQAIWQVIENTSIAVGQSGTNGEPSFTSTPAVNTLISNAETILAGGYDFSGWAVVSGAYVAGTPGALSGANIQTYLVEVTPEPRFYGLLLVGLLSLAGIIYRRRVAL